MLPPYRHDITRLYWRRLFARGFSLIELLAVIAITVILAALVYAGLQHVRLLAVRTSDADNMRQIFTGMQNYAATNHGRLPPITDKNPYGDSPGYVAYDFLLHAGGYIDTAEVFRSPADDIERTINPPSGGLPQVPRSYAINMRLFANGENSIYPAYDPPANRSANGYLNRIENPLDQVLVMWTRPSTAAWYSNTASVGFVALAANVDPNEFFGHGANYLFADGHIEFLNYQDYGSESVFMNEYFFPNP